MSKLQQNNSQPKKNPFAQKEEEIVAFWQENTIFEQSVAQHSTENPYIFYDGPPFATGLPHYGHIVGSVMKDVVPRFWTMNGYRVERVWGWDCHGLPIENMIEKELNIEDKTGIEAYGVDTFNEACRSSVLRYADEWKKIIPRLGRWVDMENDYKTMDPEYMESVWWVFRQLWERDLIFEGHKSMHVCPRCVTTLSNFEVTEGYKDVKDISATAKFHLQDEANALGVDSHIYVLAWTTTPWTLPGNVLLAVGADITYAVVQFENAHYIVAQELVEQVFEGKDGYEEISTVKGAELVGMRYVPLFPYFAETENAFQVVVGDFVTTEEGTGIVHIAPGFGEDDYRLAQEVGVPMVQHVGMDGRFTDDVTDFAGMKVKTKDEPMAADIEIIKWLAHNEKLFSKKKYDHSYPHCWRCDTPLLNYATASWFVAVTQLKDQLLKNNEQINWVPNSMKQGRFGTWLENARDWSVSRNRFWGAPLPIWKSEDGDIVCIGSIAELEELSGQKVEDLHKHIVDDITFEKDGKTYRRIPEVLDCWFESGSMPYAQMHYPFENKEKFEASFPAQFIAEGQDQTRGWFYTLHVLAAALTSGDNPAIPVKESVPAFENVIVNGIVLAEDGKKMSKRLQNYPDPMDVVNKYGADALRLYLASSPAMESENLNFLEKDVDELYRKYTNTLWNVFTFYQMFAESESAVLPLREDEAVEHVLDQWILNRLKELVAMVTQGYETYRIRVASLPLIHFVQELSTWYLRRSRDRFKGEDPEDRMMALRTLKTVLLTLSKVAAPTTPFITESIYQELRSEDDPQSVHLCSWPAVPSAYANASVETTMKRVRESIERALALRSAAGIKVRQPLQSVTVEGDMLDEAFQDIIRDELNVKEVLFGAEAAIDLHLTEDLRKEGALRELVRQTNAQRKKASLTVSDHISITIYTDSHFMKAVLETHKDEYAQSVLADAVELGDTPQEIELHIDGETVSITL